jgi:hypothetical protein
MDGKCRVRTAKKQNVYKILVRKSEVKRPLRKIRGRWEDNIKVDLEEIACEDVG